jgi:hypothetical protein
MVPGVPGRWGGSSVTKVSAVRAVSVDDIPTYYEYGLDREIVYMSEPYRIVGRARVVG